MNFIIVFLIIETELNNLNQELLVPVIKPFKYTAIYPWLSIRDKFKKMVKVCISQLRRMKCTRTVQCRNKRPTHTQEARNIFAYTRRKMRMSTRAFDARFLLLFIPITSLCVSLFSKNKRHAILYHKTTFK